MVYIPEYHSSRILIAAWWFYTIIVVGTYNGNLIAFLTAPKVEMSVNNIRDLAASSMKFGIVRSVSVVVGISLLGILVMLNIVSICLR